VARGAPPETRNWDLHLSYFGDRSNPFPDRPADITLSFERGTRAIGTVACLDKLGKQIGRYDWIWLPDDDLRADLPTLNRFFEIVAQCDLELAQPALGAGSHASYDITLQRPHLRLRYVSFVEIMAACFSRHALAICRPYLGATVSSWGPNHLFPRLLGFPARRIAIVDETPVVHARPVGSGPNLALARSPGVDPHAELADFMTTHGLTRHYETFAAIDRRGELITAPEAIEREKVRPASIGIF
jgi:hypothetical protein